MMRKLLTIFSKEWRLLWRDIVGLIFLFILPMCLVLFITLTSSVDASQPRKLKILLINKDDGGISQSLVEGLEKIDDFVINTTLGNKPVDTKSAEKSVAMGDYQAVIIIPSQISTRITEQVQKKIQKGPVQATEIPSIKILFDPALPKNFQDQIAAALQILAQTIELQLWQQTLDQLTGRPQVLLETAHSAGMMLVKTDYVSIKNGANAAAPNDVQQNVPAWALFGMFFIITPLSGIIIKERRLGVMDRLRLAPVSLSVLLWGKIIAFVMINLLQLILMLAVGVFVLPLFGLPTLNVTSHPGAIALVGLAASLAATGFGLLIGSLVRTPEQANVIGPFIIVILAAIGGIFVPPYLLPEGLKKMTEFSPMYWALQSFIDIFVRNANISELLVNIGKLLAFAIITIGSASLILSRPRR